ncbi:uncharacterized protein LOC132273911 [Cornus florida]|uniref:uncharacterized protein LOC132273911 n=1 Tax=Cornus florida TaxID=4283 RepID=UPI0028990574|nr:uncharacterized protein LOC132273911 [Cornus florida]
MKALGEDVKDSEVSKKILRSLTSRFNAMVTILEDKELSQMKIDDLQASLTAYEMRIGAPTQHIREGALKKKVEDLEERLLYLIRIQFLKKKSQMIAKMMIACLWLYLKPSQAQGEVEKDSNTKVEEILKECERRTAKCDQQKSQIKKLNSELQMSKDLLDKHFKLKMSTLYSISLIVFSVLKLQLIKDVWTTKRCKEELSQALEERSLKKAEIWRNTTKQNGKTGISDVCDTTIKAKQTHSVFVKASTSDVYVKFPIVKFTKSKYEILDNTYNILKLNRCDFVTTAMKNINFTPVYMKKSDLLQAQKVNDKGSFVKTKMMLMPKKLNSVNILVYIAFKACNTNDKWYVDSGCSRHMTGDSSNLLSLKKFDGGTMLFRDNQKAKIFGIGSVCNKKVCFDNYKCNVVDLTSDKVIFSALRSSENVYTITKKTQSTQCNLSTVDEAIMWHNRLGLVHTRNISKILKFKAVKGLPALKFKEDHTCRTYEQGKKTKVSFLSKEVNSSRSLDLIHMDLYGPTRTTSIGGSKYSMLLIDDFSRILWIYFLREKSEAITHFIKFVNLVENEKGCIVKKLRLDFGIEFTMREFESYCDVKGIKKEFSPMATPQ